MVIVLVGVKPSLHVDYLSILPASIRPVVMLPPYLPQWIGGCDKVSGGAPRD